MVAMILLYEVCMYVCMYVKFDTNNDRTKKYQILLQVIHNMRFMCEVQVQNLCLRWRYTETPTQLIKNLTSLPQLAIGFIA